MTNTTFHENQNEAGFSLIELIIAMAVTLVIASIASTLVGSSLKLRAREDARSDAVADGQRAMNIVTREMASAGFGLVGNGIVPGDTSTTAIRFRANLNAYTLDGAGNPVSGSATVTEADEDVKYIMYNDDAANRHYLVRYDVNLGADDGTTVLANRIDGFELMFFDSAGNVLDVTTDPSAVANAWRARITITVTLPAEGAPGSAGYQPASPIQLVSDVVFRNATQETY